MPYENPGAAAGSALEQFLVDRENRQRQARLDAITAAHEQRLAEQHQMDIDERRQALQEKIHQDRVSGLAKRLANMRPGDVPDAELVNEVKKYPELAGVFKTNQPPVSIVPSGQAAPVLGGQTEMPAGGGQDDMGAPLPSAMPSTESVPIGGATAPVRIQPKATTTYVGGAKERQQEEDKKALTDFIQTLDPKSAERRALEYELKTGRTAPAGMFRDIATPGKTETESVYRQNPKTGVIEHIGEVPKGSHFMTEPQDSSSKVTYQQAPELDTEGRPTGRFFGYNDKTNKYELVTGPTPTATKVAPGQAQTNKEKADTKEALAILNQMDSAIDQAAHFIGPGRGQFTSFEQMMGAGDPTASALGAKIIAMKVKIDKALSGTARASANSTLLHYWDNLLGNKVDPRNMKAAVNAMREILGGDSSSGLKVVGIEKVQ